MLARRIVHGNRRVLRAQAPFNGNFASLFPGAYQVIQSDRGLTYGGTMLDVGGIGPVLTLTGTLTGAPVPIWVVCTFAGVRGVWTFNVYYDGAGVTPEMSGVVSGGLPIRLTGAGDGLFLNIAAGAAVLNNIWKATASALADQSGNGNHMSQATAAKQPLVAPGLNSHVDATLDGVDDLLTSALNLPAPSATPTFIWAVWRNISEPSGISIHCGGNGGITHSMYCNAGGNTLGQFNSNPANGTVAAFGQWARSEAYFSNSASDYLKFGSLAAVTGANAGNSASTGYQIGNAASAGGRYSNMSVLVFILLPYLPSAAQLAAASVAVATYYGPGVAL